MHLKQDLGQLYSAIWYIKLNPFVIGLQQKDTNTFKQAWIPFCNGIYLSYKLKTCLSLVHMKKISVHIQTRFGTIL